MVVKLTGYWLCVSDEMNWNAVKTSGLWGVSERNRALLERTRINDILVFYVKPCRISGIFKIVSEPFSSQEKVFCPRKYFGEETSFPNRVKVEPLCLPKVTVDFEELVPRLSFVKNKTEWRAFVRRAMQSIPEHDYQVIMSSITHRTWTPNCTKDL